MSAHDQTISNEFKNFLLASNMKDEDDHNYADPTRKKFYISDMGKCLRVRWLKRKGIGSRFDNFVYWSFKGGELYHEYAYKVFRALGRLIECEVSLNNDHFSGRFDAIVKNENGFKDVTDVKSVGGYKMKRVIAGEADEANMAQVATYIIMLRDQGRSDIEKGRIFYMNTEPGGKAPWITHEHTFYVDTEYEKKIRAEMEQLVDYWVRDAIPPCTCVGWMKDYNSYQPFCAGTELFIRDMLEFMGAGNKVYSTKTGIYVNNEVEPKFKI